MSVCPRANRKTKISDPADGFAPLTDLAEASDATLAHRDGRWWMYLAGQRTTSNEITLFSASLPAGAPLAATGWSVTAEADNPAHVALVAGNSASAPWDRKGGRHCPAYVRGWDPAAGAWIERIYYAGAAENPWGPYAIGYLEWDGRAWVDQPEPVYRASADWERGSVYEPNLIYHDGKWRMWYVAGSNWDNYLVQGYAESADGRTGWSPPRTFAPPEWKMFDFNVAAVAGGFEAVYARVWVGKSAAPPETGLWWCRCETPASDLAAWSLPVQLMTAEDCGWHSGPWRPSHRRDPADPRRLLVFFNGIYRKAEASGFPFSFTLGAVEFDLP